MLNSGERILKVLEERRKIAKLADEVGKLESDLQSVLPYDDPVTLIDIGKRLQEIGEQIYNIQVDTETEMIQIMNDFNLDFDVRGFVNEVERIFAQ